MKSNLRFQHVILIIGCLLCCSLNRALAKHFGLSSLTYTHISGNVYHFQFTYYQDCTGVTPQTTVTLNMHSYSCGVNQDVIINKPGQGELITPICPQASSYCDGGQEPGIRKWVYEADVNIPGQCPDWIFSVYYCCRNAYFTNVQSPYEESYAEARLDNSMQDNSSPVIANEAVMFLNQDQDFHFNNGFFDPDNDSLSVAMVPAMMTANTWVTYTNGFSAQQPVTSVPPVSFNSISGDLVIHPTAPEVSMMSFRVNEFRNGALIGSITRDIGFYTLFTSSSAQPELTGVNGAPHHIAYVLPGTELCFEIFSNDEDQSDSLFLSWNHGIPAATFVSDFLKHPTGTFCWTPELSDERSTPYFFTATIRDNWCPMNSVQTYSYAVYVTSDSSLMWMNTGIPERDDFMIYPNPSSGTLHFTASETIDMIRIYDHAGKLIIADKLRSSVYKIEEPEGIYLVEILFNDGRRLKQKIIKK